MCVKRSLAAVATDIMNHAIVDGFFFGREYGFIKGVSFFNWIELIVSISEINISVNRTMHPCLTILREQENFIKSKVESLNIVQCFLKG